MAAQAAISELQTERATPAPLAQAIHVVAKPSRLHPARGRVGKGGWRAERMLSFDGATGHKRHLIVFPLRIVPAIFCAAIRSSLNLGHETTLKGGG